MTSLFQIKRLGSLRRPSGMAEFEALLEQFPQAVLVIDLRNKRIRLANSRAIELTAYTRAELTDLEIGRIFDNVPGAFSWEIPTSDKSSMQLTLMKRGKTAMEVVVSLVRLTAQNRWGIAIIEPADAVRQRLAQEKQRAAARESMKAVAGALRQSNLEMALGQILKAACQLTETEAVAIYLQTMSTGAQEISMELIASEGIQSLFPEHLPVVELAELHRPYLWRRGKRIAGELHQAARAHGLSFLATAPLGNPQAMIGLIAVASETSEPTDALLVRLEILAEVVTALIEHHTRTRNLEQELARLQRSEAIHQQVEATMSSGVIILTPQLTIARMNRSAEATLGYSSAEASGQPVDNILIGSEALLPLFQAALKGASSAQVESLHLYQRSGQPFLAQISILPIRIQEQVEGVIILLQDLSEKEQIQAHAQQLEQRALLGEVIASFAHEVRNPINNLSTGLQLMAYNLPADDPNQEKISRLQQDCDRLGEMMKMVLAFSKPTEYEMENVDIGALIGRLLERQRARHVAAGVEFLLQTEPATPLVQGNARALEQVFTNLITNAVQAMSESGGTVAVKIRPMVTGEQRRYVQIDVADNGPGIPKELQDRIFQPFFTTKPSGTGLGLAITKRIITAHKGNIRVSSFPGGTVFHVQLPAVEAQ